MDRKVRLDVRELNRIVNGIKRDYVSDMVFCSMSPRQTIPFLRTVAEGSTSVCGFRSLHLWYNDTHFEWITGKDELSDHGHHAMRKYIDDDIRVVEAAPSKGLSELIREGALNCDGKRLFVEFTTVNPIGGHAIGILIDFDEKSVDVFDVNGEDYREDYLPIIEANIQSRGFKIKKTDDVCTIPIQHFDYYKTELCKGQGMCVAAQTLHLMLRLLVPIATYDTVYEFMLSLDPEFLQTFAYFVNTRVGKPSDYIKEVTPKGTNYAQVGFEVYSPITKSLVRNPKLTNKRKTENYEALPEYSYMEPPKEEEVYKPFVSRKKRARGSPRLKSLRGVYKHPAKRNKK